MVVRMFAVGDEHIAIGKNTVMPKLHSNGGAVEWMIARSHADDLTVTSHKMRGEPTRKSNERPGQ